MATRRNRLVPTQGINLLTVVDYFSRYVELVKLSSTSSSDIINHLKSIFGRHGIPDYVVSDNGPQYASDSFTRFAKEYGFIHITSSPRYPQSNGEAERAVQTVKMILKKTDDPYIGILNYRSTPLQNGYSPAELLMGRTLRTTLPALPELLQPDWHYITSVKQQEQLSRDRDKSNYNFHHRARVLHTFNPGDKVYVKDAKVRGTVVNPAKTPRSYIVETPTGKLRRNRRHLAKTSGPITGTRIACTAYCAYCIIYTKGRHSAKHAKRNS